MKTTILITLILFTLTSCCNRVKTKYTYKLTYLDGTTETITRDYELRFIGDADCIARCDCGNEERFCGIRKLDLISKKEIKPKKNLEKINNKSRNDFDY